MAGGNQDSDDRRITAIMQIAESLAGDEVRDGYTFIGAATSGAFRFKWVARELEDGRFVVDETVGAGTVAVSSRPIPREEVLPYINERRQRIQRRIDDVKRELASVAVALPPVPLKQADWPRPTDPVPPVEIPEDSDPSDATAEDEEEESLAGAGDKPASEPAPAPALAETGLSPAAPAPPKTPAETPALAAAERPSSPIPKTERDPDEIFEEIRRMLQES